MGRSQKQKGYVVAVLAAFGAGFNSHLTKPASMEAVESLLASIGEGSLKTAPLGT